MVKSSKIYDIVVYGATGYTGMLTAEYLAQKYGEGGLPLKWAIAGRSERKLADLKATLLSKYSTSVDIVLADVADQTSLNSMCNKAKVCIDCVGPYILYGEPVVKACIDNGCHFVDITGEPAYVFMLMKKYHSLAATKDVLIVPNCGFDCIPADIGGLYNVTRVKDSKNVSVVSNYIADMKGMASSGTLKSLLLILTNFSSLPQLAGAVLGAWSGQHSQNGLRNISGAISQIFGFFSNSPILRPHFNLDLQSYVVPLPVLDPVCAKRSSELLPKVYAPNFKFGHFLELPNVFAFLFSVIVFAVFPFIQLICAIPGIKHMILYLLDQLPQGSEASRQGNYFRCRQVGRDANDRIVSVTEIYGPDAYTATAEMSAQCAIQIVESRSSMDVKNGVSTPAASFGLELVDRLNTKTSISFKHLK